MADQGVSGFAARWRVARGLDRLGGAGKGPGGELMYETLSALLASVDLFFLKEVQ